MPAKYTANANGDGLQTGSQSSPTDVDHIQHQSGLETMHPVSTSPYGNPGVLWNFENETAAGFGRAFQDVFFSLDNFDVGADFANSDAFLGPEFLPDANGASQNENIQTAYDTNRQLWSAGVGNENNYREKALIEHFVTSADPISVILPTHTEWTSACRSLLAMANESPFLLSAICALSAIHLCVSTLNESYPASIFDCHPENIKYLVMATLA